MLTPLDIDNKQFTKQFKGYDAKEVDDFLDEISDDYDKLMQDNVELQKKIEEQDAKIEQYRGLETTLQETLIVAKGTADNMIDIAKKESEQILQKAKTEAEQKIKDINQEVDQRRLDLDNVKKEVNMYKAKVEATLISILEMLKDIGDQEEY